MAPETIRTIAAPIRDPVSPESPSSRSSQQEEVEIEIDAAAEKSLVRKLDRRLVLVAFLCYLAAMLDRSNIGNAEAAGMSEDLGMSGAQYQWLLTIFYIGYIVFEWLGLMWKIFPPHIWASAVSSICGTLMCLYETCLVSCEHATSQNTIVTNPNTNSASSSGAWPPCFKPPLSAGKA